MSKQEQRFEVTGTFQIIQGFVAITIKSLYKLPVIEPMPSNEREKEMVAAGKMMTASLSKIVPVHQHNFLRGQITVSMLDYKSIGSPTVGDFVLISIKKEVEPTPGA